MVVFWTCFGRRERDEQQKSWSHNKATLGIHGLLMTRKRNTQGGPRILAQYADTQHLASVSTYQSVLRVGSLLKGHAPQE